MAKSATQKFLDLQLKSTVNLERYSESVKRKVFKILNDTQDEILSEIVKQESRVPIAQWRKRRLRNLQKSIDGIVDTNYAKIAKESRKEMEQISMFTGKETVAHLNGVIGAQLANVTLTQEGLKAIADNTMVDGQVIGDWWRDQKDDFKKRATRQMADATQQVQLGMVKGESIKELVGRIRGTALAPGIMDMGKRNATALVRTSVMQVANESRMAMYEGNKDLINGYEFVATLDKRTTPICRAYDGKQWIETDGILKPKGHKLLFRRPPLHWQCFIDGQTSIFTSKGWKHIRYIKVGDLVLTHKGRFRRVKELIFTPKQTPNVVKINLKNKDDMLSRLTMTEEHPVLVGTEWKFAKGIQVGEKIHFLATECGYCGKLIPYYRKFCSLSCRSKVHSRKEWTPERRSHVSKLASAQLNREYANGTRDRNEIVKKMNETIREKAKRGVLVHQLHLERWSEYMKGTHTLERNKGTSERMKKSNPNFTPEVRKRMTASYKKTILAHPEKHPNYIMAQKGFMSSLERKFKDLLDGIGIFYEQQYPIKQFFVDFAIPSLKIAIEVDGNYWHQDKDKARDYLRQKEIEAEGWFVLRYSEDQINECLEEVSKEVSNIVCNHKGEFKFIQMEVVFIQKWQLKRARTLYNFSVEEDESYVAKGFVVHNCRSTVIPILKSFADLAGPKSTISKAKIRKLEKLSPAQRAAMTYDEKLLGIGKPVSGGMSYNDWLLTQPEAVQIDVLGPGRFRLWKQNKLSMADMVNQKGRPLTIAQLEERFGEVEAESLKFIPAKTIDAAKIWAENNIADRVEFKKNYNLAGLNAINRTVQDINKRFGMEKLRYLGDPDNIGVYIRYPKGYVGGYAHNSRTLEEYGLVFRNKFTDAKKLLSDDVTAKSYYTSKNKLGSKLEFLRRSKANKDVLRIAENFTAKDIRYNSNLTPDGVTAHEMGHRIWNKHSDNKKIWGVTNKAWGDGYQNVMSEYSKHNVREFFAESFSAYYSGEYNRLSPDLLKLFKEIDNVS